MSYSAQTFVADEQPTTAKWNILWSNDASFNDGTGIADNAILQRHLSDDIVAAAEMINGQIYRRKGGSSTIWGSAGTTTYDVSGTDVKIQTGFTANSSSPTAHTYPVAYTYAPIVLAAVASATGANCYCAVSSITTTGFNCQVVTDAGAANTNQTISWLAIGV